MEAVRCGNVSEVDTGESWRDRDDGVDEAREVARCDDERYRVEVRETRVRNGRTLDERQLRLDGYATEPRCIAAIADDRDGVPARREFSRACRVVADYSRDTGSTGIADERIVIDGGDRPHGPRAKHAAGMHAHRAVFAALQCSTQMRPQRPFGRA